MLYLKQLLLAVASDPISLGLFIVLSVSALLFVFIFLDHDFVLAHELGHAQKIHYYLNIFKPRSPIFVLLPFQNKNGEKFQKDGILVYYLGKKMKNIFDGKKIGGVTMWNTEVIPLDPEMRRNKLPDEDTNASPFLIISQAGIDGGKKFLTQIKFSVAFLSFTFAVNLCLRWLLDDVRVLEKSIALSLIIAVVFCFLIYLRIKMSAGLHPQKEIERYEELIKGSDDGAIIDPIICDSAKIKYFDRYMDCNQRFKDKKLQNKYSYSTVIQLLKDNYGIDVLKDYDNIDNIKEL